MSTAIVIPTSIQAKYTMCWSVPTLTWVLSRGEQPCWSTRTCRISLCPYVAAKTTGTTPLCGLEAEYVHKCRYQWGHTHTCMHATHTHTTHSHEHTHTHNLSPTRDCLLGSQPCRVMSSFTRVRLPPQTAWCRQSRPSCTKSREHTLYMLTDMVCMYIHTYAGTFVCTYIYVAHLMICTYIIHIVSDSWVQSCCHDNPGHLEVPIRARLVQSVPASSTLAGRSKNKKQNWK